MTALNSPKPAVPPRVHDHFKRSHLIARANAAIAVKVTEIVGTMWCCYIFCVFAALAAPIFATSGVFSWICQAVIQLVLLPLIMVGQKVDARASDARAEQTYADTELILAEIRSLKERIHD